MRTCSLFAHASVGLLLVLLIAIPGVAAERQVPVRETFVIHGGNATLHKGIADTLDLMGPTGSGAPYLGDFEAGWNGWTSVDLTQFEIPVWQVSDYNQAQPGNLAAWCGSLAFAACGESDVVGGYGNNWNSVLELRLTVHDLLEGATVRVTGTLQNDTEPGYDYTYLSVEHRGQIGYIDLMSWDGQEVFAVDEVHTLLASDLVGGNEVVVSFRVVSDGGWSDEDCSFASAGACQVDDIAVTVSQPGQTDLFSFTDFQDGTFGNWNPYNDSAGDFAALWSGLRDADPCASNSSQQVAFIDDGIVVPGTGGTMCLSWCYGPGGYIVNNSGGLLGSSGYLHNAIESPVMSWPNAAYDGIQFRFDVYRHEEFTSSDAGIFYTWGIRSADTDDSAGNGVQVLADATYFDRNFVYFGGPDYIRAGDEVTDLMHAGRDVIQLRLGIYELGWAWGIDGSDGTPAPYFDNVSVKVYPVEGPALTVTESNLAQDSFPAADLIDFNNLGAMSVRFDAARNIAPDIHLHNDPGDSIVVDVVPLRAGSVLFGAPEMHYIIDANPVFDGFRTTATSGVVAGLPVVVTGFVWPDRYAFDLPDTGTLFPGDVLHYYIRGGDEAAGNIKYATLPADLTGYGEFGESLVYDRRFVVRALPTIESNGMGWLNVPDILVWDDSGDIDRANILYGNMIYASGPNRWLEFDFYRTTAAGQGVGSGVGGRTDGGSLAKYTTIIYAAGANDVHTLSHGDFTSNPGNDIGALSTWLDQGNRNLFLSGDGLVTDLDTNQGAPGLQFLAGVMGVDLFNPQARLFINNQIRPLVLTTPGNGVFNSENAWLVEGGCPSIRDIDAVTVRAGAIRLAEFADQNGSSGAYNFSAATLNFHDGTDKIISMPYDGLAISDPSLKTPDYWRFPATVLCDILWVFGLSPACLFPGPVPESGRETFAVTHYPNPFNPATRMEYTIAGPGHLSLKIYNVRGQLVRTLIDGPVQTSGFVMWDGKDNGGASVASGVYFSEAEMAGEVQVNKLALIK